MRIAFDIHGTIDTGPEVFKPIMIMLMRAKVDVIIISGPPIKQINSELLKLGYNRGIHYNCAYSVVDYLKSINTDMYQDNNKTWWCSEKTWWRSKGFMCKDMFVDVVIDNDFRYQHQIEKHSRFFHWDSRMKEKTLLHEMYDKLII